jgi:hypothetical protein
MVSPLRWQGLSFDLTALSMAFLIWGMSGSSAVAQGANSAAGSTVSGNSTPGYYPYPGYGAGDRGYPGYNIYGNFGVYGYPGSGIEGGTSNPGYDPGYGGYPSFGGFGITNRYPPRAYGLRAPFPRRLLGIDEEPVALSDGSKGMKIGKVYPGTAAEKAGLKAGDVIRSINGYFTEQRGNLAWIIANKAPNNELKLTVRTANDSQDHQITATLP